LRRGWSIKDVERLTGTPALKKEPKPKKIGKDYPAEICEVLDKNKIEYQREYKFLHDRRFRFDIAIPSLKIAIEFEGGVFSGGRHTRGKGYISDCKKYNLATMHGWKLLRYTTADAKVKDWGYAVLNDVLAIDKTEERNGTTN